MKKLSAILLSLILSLVVAIMVWAGPQSRLVDDGDLLSESEEEALRSKLDDISEQQQLDIVIVTVDSTGDHTPMAYSEAYYSGHDYRPDGIMLLVSMGDRDLWILTAGYGSTAITDAGREYMFDQFQPFLRDGDFREGFEVYADLCDEFITQARSGRPYDVKNMPREPFHIVFYLLVSLFIGFVVAFLVVALMKSQLKSVRFQPAAEGYVKSGSMKITESRDLFLYRHVDRRAKPKNTSDRSGRSRPSVSSSGAGYKGGGRKF